MNGGLSGILIVKDQLSEMPDELAIASCPKNCEYDIQLLFQPHLIFSSDGFGALQKAMHDYEGFQ